MRTHIGNRIEIFELLHDDLSDHTAWNLFLLTVKDFQLHSVKRLLDRVRRNRTLIAGAQDTLFNL